jgi:hypothetical protein
MKHPLFSAKGRRTWLWNNARRRNRFLALAALTIAACTVGMVALRMATTPPPSTRTAAGVTGVLGSTALTFPTLQPLPGETPLPPTAAATLTGGDSDTEHAESQPVAPPDPAAFAVTAVNAWLTGQPFQLPPDAPAPVLGATIPGPGEVVSSGDTFAAVTVPLALTDGTTSSVFVVLSLSDQDAGQWSVAQLVVSA